MAGPPITGTRRRLSIWDPIRGVYSFTATAGGLRMFSPAICTTYPAIPANGVVNAASGQVGQGLAPGSYISIFGTNLATATQATSTLSLPVVLSTVSVSFDGGGLSLPGHLTLSAPDRSMYRSRGSFEGQTSVKMKVTFAACQAISIRCR